MCNLIKAWLLDKKDVGVHVLCRYRQNSNWCPLGISSGYETMDK